MNAHYKIPESKTTYAILGINMNGEKEVLGIWEGADEISKLWLSVLNDLKNRSVR